MHSINIKAFAVYIACLMLSTCSTPAQTHCWPHWDPLCGTEQPNGDVYCAVRWRPPVDDAHELLVISGYFTDACGTEANMVAAWDPITHQWSSFGLPRLFDYVGSMTVTGTGELVISGGIHFEIRASPLISWNGSHWSTFASEDLGSFGVLATLRNGNVVATAVPVDDSAQRARRIGEWTGRAWRRLGSDADNSVFMLTPSPDGSLYAAGNFQHIGGVACSHIARWNGHTWQPLGDGLDGPAYAGMILADGSLAVVGAFHHAGGVEVLGAARWNGSWSPLASEPFYFYDASSITELNDGRIAIASYPSTVVVGRGSEWTTLPGDGGNYHVITDSTGELITYGNQYWPTPPISRRVGDEWLPLSAGLASVSSVSSSPQGNLVVGGWFHNANGYPAADIAELIGKSWHPLGDGLDDAVHAMAKLPNGDLIAGGRFNFTGTLPLNGIGRWDGTAWHPMGSGFPPFDHDVYAIYVTHEGHVVVGGTFNRVDGVPASNIAMWDGTRWLPLGGGLDAPVRSISQMQDGSIVAVQDSSSGTYGVRRWNGRLWNRMDPEALRYGYVSNVFTTSHGMTCILGTEYGAAAPLWWNVDHWSPLGRVNSFVWPADYGAWLGETPDGTLIASSESQGHYPEQVGSSFYAWNGTTWEMLGDAAVGSVNSMTWLPNGKAYACGTLRTRGVGTTNLARISYAGEPPTIVRGPADQLVERCQLAEFTVTATSASELQYHWEYRFENDPPETWHSFVRSDGSDYDENLRAVFMGETTSSLSMSAPRVSLMNPDAVQVRCMVRNQCNASSTMPARIIGCFADFNCDGGVDGTDLSDFFTLWEIGSYSTDLDGNTAVDMEDVAFYLQRWAEGC